MWISNGQIFIQRRVHVSMRPIHSVTEDIFMLRLARKVLSLACSEKKGTGCPPKYSYE